MRKRLKRSSLGLLGRAGLFRAFANSDWRAQRLVILCYHGISIEDEHEWDPTLYMSPSDFAHRLEILKRDGYRVLPLAEAVERMYARDLPPRSVALTFDDGGYDFYRQAWPVLRAHGYPATVYLTTYYCQDNRPIFDPASSYLLWKARGKVLDGARLGLKAPLDLRTPDSRRAAWRRILAFAADEEWGAGDKDRFLQRLAGLTGFEYCGLLRKRLLHIMNPQEVAELHGEGLDVQLHTHRHRTPDDRGLFLREISENRARIFELTGVEPEHFCYPCGVKRQEFLPWLKEASVRYAVTCVPGLASVDSAPLLLPRFVDHANLSPIEFESCVSGFGLLLPNEG
jgi:peptidoglycan/xylan/chitin deacetylase (PgdA/CDA1 family)